MDTKNCIKHLKTLGAISPDPVFLMRSRQTILACAVITPWYQWTNQRIALPLFSFGLACAAILLLITTFSAPSAAPPIVAGLQNKELIEEQRAVTQLQLSETIYNKTVAPAVALALKEIADPSTRWHSTDYINKSIAALNAGPQN